MAPYMKMEPMIGLAGTGMGGEGGGRRWAEFEKEIVRQRVARRCDSGRASYATIARDRRYGSTAAPRGRATAGNVHCAGRGGAVRVSRPTRKGAGCRRG